MSRRRPTFNGRPMPVRYCGGGCMRDLDELTLDELANGACCLDCAERIAEPHTEVRANCRDANGGKLKGHLIGQDKATKCQLCGAVAVLPLTVEQIKKQPDETTHVCHPGFGGCNHGFASEVRS